MYLVNAILPKTSIMAPKVQQKIRILNVSHLIEVKRMVDEGFILCTYIRYIRLLGISKMKVVSVSDASHGAVDSEYGQSGSLGGLMVTCMGDNHRIFHTLRCTIHKQKIVTYSTLGAEILAASDTDDRAFDIKTSLESIFTGMFFEH